MNITKHIMVKIISDKAPIRKDYIVPVVINKFGMIVCTTTAILNIKPEWVVRVNMPFQSLLNQS